MNGMRGQATTLADQLKAKQLQTNQPGGAALNSTSGKSQKGLLSADLDFLDSLGSGSNTPARQGSPQTTSSQTPLPAFQPLAAIPLGTSPVSKPISTLNNSAIPISPPLLDKRQATNPIPSDPWDALLSTNTKSSPSANYVQPSPHPGSSTANDAALLDDFFGPTLGVNSHKPTLAQAPKPEVERNVSTPQTAFIATSAKSKESPVVSKQESKMESSQFDSDRASDDHLARLVDMGFDENNAAQALQVTNNNLDGAVQYLLNSNLQRNSKEGATPSMQRLFGKASSLFNKSKAIVQSRVEGIRDQGGVLANVVNVVSNKLEMLNQGTMSSRSNSMVEVDDQYSSYAPYSDGGGSPVPDTPPLAPSTSFSNKTKPASIAAQMDPPSLLDAIPIAQISSVKSTTARASPPPPKSRPPFVTCDNMSLEQCNLEKEKGTSFYKLGQYHDAVSHYNTAIQFLPMNHLALVALYNNRAAAELKTGEYTECIRDTEASMSIIKYYGGVSAMHNEQLCDATCGITVSSQDEIKALLRKATALENLEKYSTSKEVYSLILGFDSKNKVAMEGITRCNRALSGPSLSPQPGSSSPPATSANSKSSPAKSAANGILDMFEAPSGLAASVPAVDAVPLSKSEVDKSSAVQEMRKLEKRAEKEADAALAVKDDVDAKIAAWSKGKETNLRALLSSMEMVLWPELNWQKANLGELITPSQVKVKYMKAISKVHPDKLKTENISYKLLANSVFSILNEAWDAFRQQNNI
jgi:tetratricopeptide (TPR) repeat protein